MTLPSRVQKFLVATAIGGAALVAVASPLRAADPVFPMASVIGLVPPGGMVASKTFPGFEDADKDAAILLAAQAPAFLHIFARSNRKEILGVHTKWLDGYLAGKIGRAHV